jgi:hypothetical protein
MPMLKEDVAKALMVQEKATNACVKAVNLGGEAIILAITTRAGNSLHLCVHVAQHPCAASTLLFV